MSPPTKKEVIRTILQELGVSTATGSEVIALAKKRFNMEVTKSMVSAEKTALLAETSATKEASKIAEVTPKPPITRQQAIQIALKELRETATAVEIIAYVKRRFQMDINKNMVSAERKNLREEQDSRKPEPPVTKEEEPPVNAQKEEEPQKAVAKEALRNAEASAIETSAVEDDADMALHLRDIMDVRQVCLNVSITHIREILLLSDRIGYEEMLQLLQIIEELQLPK